jgi:nicotinate phosphoribosyltransferase
MFTASWEDVRSGRTTDVYFLRTLRILQAKGIDKFVRAEIMVKDLPHGWPWGVLAGVEETLGLLREFKNTSVRSMPEGTIFRPYEPVMEISGPYTEFAVYETALLGFLCQASGVATKTARLRKLAGDKTMVSFGARRMHPAISPMIERSAYIGGADGTSVVMAAELLGLEAAGTMPHALILVMGSTVEAVKAFHEVIEPHVRRVALIDTFHDEKFEALNVAQVMGDALHAVRLDTPGSRRGNFYRIIEEVRWELDLRGFKNVKIFVSGGLDEEQVRTLNPVVDAYGVGTSIANAPVVDLALDIVEVDGTAIAKRGKASGRKQVWRCTQCQQDKILPIGSDPGKCECGGDMEGLLKPLTDRGEVVAAVPTAQDIRSYVLAQLPRFEL